MEALLGAGLFLFAVFVIGPLLEKWWFPDDRDASMVAVYIVLVGIPMGVLIWGLI